MPVEDTTTDYSFEWDLNDIDFSTGPIVDPLFSVQGNKFNLRLQKNKESANYDCLLRPKNTTSVLFPGHVRCKFDLVYREDAQVVHSRKCRAVYYKTSGIEEVGGEDFIDPETVQSHILKVKVWTKRGFSDFVEKPESFKGLHLSHSYPQSRFWIPSV
jgi:hypothetical protein